MVEISPDRGETDLMRAAAVEALGDIGGVPAEAISAIEALNSDESPRAREAAAAALERLH